MAASVFSKREAPVVAELSDALHLRKKKHKKKQDLCLPTRLDNLKEISQAFGLDLGGSIR